MAMWAKWNDDLDAPDRNEIKEELVYQDDWEQPNTVDAVPGTNWRPGSRN